MQDHIVPMLLTRLLYESEDPQATLAEIKRVLGTLEMALDEIEMIPPRRDRWGPE